MELLSTARKAFVAFAIGLSGSLAVAGVDNSIKLGEALVAFSVALVAFGGVYGVRNEPAA